MVHGLDSHFEAYVTPFLFTCMGCGREIWHECYLPQNMFPPCAPPWCPHCRCHSMVSPMQWHHGQRDAQAFLRALTAATKTAFERRAS